MTEHCVATIPAGFGAFADDTFDDVSADSWVLEAFAAERAPARAVTVTRARAAAPSRARRSTEATQATLARGAYWWVLAGALVMLALR